MYCEMKEGEATAWVNSWIYMYHRKAIGKLRSVDTKELNKEVHRKHYVISTLKEILQKLTSAISQL